jgi:hypothetical protein
MVRMIRVAQDDLRAGAADIRRAEPAHDAMGADRHEGGRHDLAVGQVETSRARHALGGLDSEFEHRS